MSQIIRSKALAGLLVFAMVIFVAPAVHAASIGNLTLTGSPVQGGNSFSPAGSCPSGGSVTFSLLSSTGVITNLGSSTTTGLNGSFSPSLNIPVSANTGATTLVATCSNGDTVTLPINITANPTSTNPNGLTLSGTPVQGSGTFGLSGTCSTSGNVTFSLVGSNGVITNLGTSATTSGNNNAFNTNSLNVPANYSTGNTTLVATCPNGTTLPLAINVLVPSTSLITFNTPAPAISGTVNVSGICGAANNGSTVTFTLTRGGTVTNLASTTTANGVNGAFSTNVTLPANSPAGLGTLTANCGNGQTISTLAVIGDPSQINLTLYPANPTVNGSVNVTGVCPTTSNGVTFSVQQNGSTTNVGSGVTTVGLNGAFSTNLTIPNTINAGAANIIATCNNNGGSVATGAVLGVATTVPTTVGGGTTPTGAVGGVSTTPVGGVRAGAGGTADTSSSSMELFFMLTGVVALALLFAGKQMRDNA
jgi:hypothetical protein